MRRDFDCCRLEVEQLVAEVLGDTKFGQPCPRFLRQVIGDLDVDVVGRDQFLSCPTLLDNLDEFFRDIDAPTVVPPVFEPFGKFLAGVVIQHVDVEFALKGKSRLREVAAAQISDRRVHRVWPEQQIELGV